MATRSGSVDPGALVAVMRRPEMDADALDHTLNEESGMRGLAGGDGLMLELEHRAAAGDEQARLAFDVYVHRVAGAVAAMAVAAGGIDVLVFTAGIGERSPGVRAAVCDRLVFLGVEKVWNAGRNAAATGDAGTSRAPGAAVRGGRVTAREELVAARAARAGAGRLSAAGVRPPPVGKRCGTAAQLSSQPIEQVFARHRLASRRTTPSIASCSALISAVVWGASA